MTEADWDELAALGRAPRVVGIGETGLDYYYDHSPRDAQREAYRRFIALARDVGRPVISHVRDAHDDAAEILAASRRRDAGRRHPLLHRRRRRGAALPRPRPAPVVLGHPHLQERRADPRGGGVRAADRILVETDAPFLAPIPYRGKRNEPAFVVKTRGDPGRPARDPVRGGGAR